MAAKRTLGWISGLTLATMAVGCASQTPSMTAPQEGIPNRGPAIIEGDTLIVPLTEFGLQGAEEGKDAVMRWNAKDFASLPGRISAAGGAAAEPLIPAPLLSTRFPGALTTGFPGVWPGAWMGGAGYCAAPYGFAFGTPGIFPKTLFINPDVYYLRRNALYFPYSRLGGYFYPVSIPYGARFFTPLLAYGFGGLSPYTFTSATCPVGAPFPGPLPIGDPGVAPDVGNGGDCGGNGGECSSGQQYGHKHDHKHSKQMQQRQQVRYQAPMQQQPQQRRY
jgi:hypothetical protein